MAEMKGLLGVTINLIAGRSVQCVGYAIVVWEVEDSFRGSYCVLYSPRSGRYWPLILPLHSRLYCHSRPLIEVNFQPAQLYMHQAEGMESTIDDEAGK